jgi:hypothetical protein
MQRLLRQAKVLGDRRHPLTTGDQTNGLVLEFQRVARPCRFCHVASISFTDFTQLWEALHAGKVIVAIMNHQSAAAGGAADAIWPTMLTNQFEAFRVVDQGRKVHQRCGGHRHPLISQGKVLPTDLISRRHVANAP